MGNTVQVFDSVTFYNSVLNNIVSHKLKSLLFYYSTGSQPKREHKNKYKCELEMTLKVSYFDKYLQL